MCREVGGGTAATKRKVTCRARGAGGLPVDVPVVDVRMSELVSSVDVEGQGRRISTHHRDGAKMVTVIDASLASSPKYKKKRVHYPVTCKLTHSSTPTNTRQGVGEKVSPPLLPSFSYPSAPPLRLRPSPPPFTPPSPRKHKQPWGTN